MEDRAKLIKEGCIVMAELNRLADLKLYGLGDVIIPREILESISEERNSHHKEKLKLYDSNLVNLLLERATNGRHKFK